MSSQRENLSYIDPMRLMIRIQWYSTSSVPYRNYNCLVLLKSKLSPCPTVFSYLGDVVPGENLSDLQTRPGYVSGLSPQSSVLVRHSGDIIPEEKLRYLTLTSKISVGNLRQNQGSSLHS